MNYEIIPYGTNIILNDNNYIFSPYAYKNMVKLQIFDDMILSFTLNFDSSIKYIIVKTKKDNQIVNKPNTDIQLNCNTTDKIYIIPVYYLKEFYEKQNNYNIHNIIITLIKKIEPYTIIDTIDNNIQFFIRTTNKLQ